LPQPIQGEIDMAKAAPKKSAMASGTKRNVVPDRLDLRDRPYMPPVSVVPAQALEPAMDIPVLDQGQTNACTGFALASVIYHLQRSAGRTAAQSRVSPFMLYSMARRYDEFPGNPTADTGSSARGAMKGWFKYGACASALWPTETVPKATKAAKDDWWLDAVRRPLGAYYRLDTRAITDMHVALNEVKVLYVSAACHSGWDKGLDVKTKGMWHIPRQKATPADGGHAFVIVGYDRDGFIIQNSWGSHWGTGGRAILHYEDWLDNAMDCWVAQMGAVTDLHEEIAGASSLRLRDGKVHLAGDPTLRAREISPFVIDMENNGRLSNTGDYRTTDADVEALVTQQLSIARSAWGLKDSDPVDIAIYAHGGLTSEDDAAVTAAKWIPALYDHKIFPIFLMWETDLISTLRDRLEDALEGGARAAGGPLDAAKSWWNERLEALLAHPGSMIWGEMKKNGEAISTAPDAGGIKLFEAAKKSPLFSDLSKIRLHLIGHSAGSIVHSHIIRALCSRGWTFETVNFMAPAVRLDVFRDCVAAHLKSGKVKALNQFHLSDDIEQKDPTCKPILGYSRSLLYLVSRSFEGGVVTPILGMEKCFNADGGLGLPGVRAWAAPGPQSKATTHGGFDDDDTTRDSVIALIKGQKI
jgi:hypothetical protein